MGQGCSGSLSDVLSDPANNGLDSLNGVALLNGHSRSDTLWRHAHSRRINELLETFSPEDVQRLLLLYRSKCYAERSQLLLGNPTSHTKAPTQPLIQPAWRRVTLSDSVLFSLFPSLHVTYTCGLLESLSCHGRFLNGLKEKNINEEKKNEVDWRGVINQLRLVDKKHLIRAFHCASYLYNPIDAVDTTIKGNNVDLPKQSSLSPGTSFKVSQSVLNLNTSTTNTVANNKNASNVAVFTPTEVLLQDFLFALSLCQSGTYEEQLTLLFVLFAEPIVENNNGNNSSSTSSNVRRNSHSTMNNVAVTRPTSTGVAGSNTATVTSEPRSPDLNVELTSMQNHNDNDIITTATTAVTANNNINNNQTTTNLAPAMATTNTTTNNNNADPILPPATTTTTPLVSNKSRTSLTASSKTTEMSGEKTQLQKLELTEIGALRMWVFMQLQLLRVMNPVLSMVCSSNTNCSKYSTLSAIDVSSIDWSDCCGIDNSVYTTLLYYAEKLATQQALPSTNANSSTALSYAEFIKLAYTARPTQTLPDYCHLNTNNGTNNSAYVSIFDTLQQSNVLSAFNVRSVLTELGNDVLSSYTQVQRLSSHQLNPRTSRLHKDLHTCLSVLNTQQDIPKEVRSVHEVFALDARWFLEWCRRNKLTPVFYNNNIDPTTTITTTINTSIVYNSSNLTVNLPVPSPKSASPKKKHHKQKYKPPYKDTSADIKHLLVGLVPMVEVQSDISGNNRVNDSNSGNDGSKEEKKEASMPALHNATLLYKDALGVYRLKPPSQLLPYTPNSTTTTALLNNSTTTNNTTNTTFNNTTSSSSDVDTYVIVPFLVGQAMYEYFDPQSQYIAASVYKRVLRIASNALPVPTEGGGGGSNADGDVQRDALQAIAPTATQLVKNFQSVNTVYLSSHPPLVPIYVCSAYGTASVAPVDNLMVTILPPVSEHAPSVCSVHSTYGMYGSSSGDSGSNCGSNSGSVEMTTIQDFTVHTSSVLMGPDKGISEPQGVCRVWGLFTETTQDPTNTVDVPCLQHTTTTVWRLLTKNADDYTIPLSTLLTNPDSSTGSGRNKARILTEQQLCLGLMVEYTTTPYILHYSPAITTDAAAMSATDANTTTSIGSSDPVYSVWPTDRILHAQGHTRFSPEHYNNANNKECPFSIAEHIDILNNNNQWCVGIVTNIARDHVPTRNDPHNVNVSITVRPLVDSDGRAIASKVPKLSGPGVRNTMLSKNNPEPATTNSPDSVANNRTTAPEASPVDELTIQNKHTGSEEEDEEEEGSEEGSVESAIVNNPNTNDPEPTAVPKNNALSSGHGERVNQNGQESEEGSGSEESSSDGESADDNSLIRDRRSTTRANPATAAVKNGLNNGTTITSSDTKAGVTWPNSTDANSTNTNNNVVIVSYNSLRILDLGTMTNPTITYGTNNTSTVAYLSKVFSSLHTTYRQHLSLHTMLTSATVDKPIQSTITASANASRQPSQAPLPTLHSNSHINIATPTKVTTSSTNITLQAQKQDSNSALTGPKTSLFNSPSKHAVFPHTPDVNNEDAEPTQENVDNSNSPVMNGECSAELTSQEWNKLSSYMYNVSTCPFPLRTLYIMLITERIALLPLKHPYKCRVSITSGLYDIHRYLHVVPSVSPEMIGIYNSVDDNHSTTSYSSSNAPHYKNHQRDPVSKFFKGCGKSIQRSFAPRKTEVVGQTELLNHLNHTASANTTKNTTNTHGETNPTDDPEEHRSAVREERSRPNSARGNSSSTLNTHNNNSNAHFPHQKHPSPRSNTNVTNNNTTLSATIAKPQVTSSVGNIGIRIVGVAGLNNLGNTCFMSASLQCLFRTNALVNYFLTMQYKLDINTRSNLGSKGKLTEEFAKFVHGIFSLPSASLSSIQHYAASTINTTSIPRSLQYTSYSPTPLLRAFQAHKPQFSGADQQDSQEFLCELLDTFHEDLKLPRSSSGGGSGGSSGGNTNVDNNNSVVKVGDAAAISGGANVNTVDDGKPTTAAIEAPADPTIPSVDEPNPNTTTDTNTVIPATTATAIDASNAVNPSTTVTATTNGNLPVTHRERAHSSMGLEKRHSRSNSYPLLTPTETERTLSVQEQGNHTWAHYMQNNASIVTNLFQGQMCSKIVCNFCHTSSANFEPFTTLSMPIPRTNAVSIAHNELTTVFLTVYRKLPRLQRILHLPDYVFDHGQLTEGQLIGLYQSTRSPVKLALSFPRNTTIEQVLLKAVNMYNQYELQCVEESYDSNPYNNNSGGGNEQMQASNNSTNGNIAPSPVTRAASTTPILRQQSSLSQRSHPNNGTPTHSAEVNNSPTDAEDNTPTYSDNGNNSTASSTNNNTPSHLYGNKGASSIYVIQPLVLANTIVIDINDKKKLKYGKMLDKKDILQTLLDENTNECHLVLQERVKDISFVAGLSASRLNADYVRNQRPQQLTLRDNNHNNNTTQVYFPSLLGYFDQCEYDASHVLYNDAHTLEGPLVCDFDYTYDVTTYPKHSSNTSLTAMINKYAEQNATLHYNNTTTTATTTTSSSNKTRKTQPPLLAHISATHTTHTYNNTKPWPTSLEYFQIGDRVDCLDYKGTWYSGSVIDILDLTENDIKQHQLLRYSRDFMLQPHYGTNNSSPSSKVMCTPGLHMRVHFDGFKGNWDEWYDQKDFQCGFIAPVFSNASRKLKMHEIPVLQRRLVYTSTSNSSGSNNIDQPPTPPGYSSHTDNSPTNSNTSVSLHIDILDNPSFIQGESYRSCLHLYNHIHEQMLRYVDNELLLHTLQLPVGHPDQPFSIRVLSYDDMLTAPIDCYCPVTTVAAANTANGAGGDDNARAENGVQQNGTAAGPTAVVTTSNVSPGLQFTIADRFNGHKHWEGSGLPMDVCRPIGNIYHSKLVIAVDWIVYVDNTTNIDSSGMNGNGTGTNRAMTPIGSGIAAGLLHDSMVYRHEPSYTQYLIQLKEKQLIMQQNEVRKREQQAREDRMKGKTGGDSGDSGGSNNGNNGSNVGESTGYSNSADPHKPVDRLLEAYHNDQRNGLTIEEVLSKFVHSEDIEEYYCNTCKKQTPGKLHSSIHTLPDVLILHLQRLVMNGNGGGKIRTLVKFPLSQLNMQPFTTEQKELVSSLADKGVSYVNGNSSAVNSEEADNKDVYELYGVVNHIGGMNGGHYTALSKVEEVVLNDVMKQRYCNTDTTSNNSGSGLAADSSIRNNRAKSDSICYDDVSSHVEPLYKATKLSLSEFIATTTTTSTTYPSGTATPNADSSHSHSSSCNKAASRWLKFDDEFVNVVPSANLHTNVVTESAVLLFYQRKNMSPKNLIRYI